MSGDKRSVSTDALETLGTIIGPEQKRDAIHLAVIPAYAGHTLRPGDDIGIIDLTTNPPTMGHCDESKAIVDPFLKNLVAKGDIFWAVIYPRKITSLRHVWSHPDFPEVEVKPMTPLDAYKANGGGTVSNSEPYCIAYLRNYAEDIGVTLKELISNTKDYLEDGIYWVEGDKFKGVYLPDGFWGYFSEATGIQVPADKQNSFFSCSC